MMIQVDKLSKDFGSIKAVDEVSFEVGQGEVVGFLGENGAGKTTTIRILTTYLPATSGIARIAGYDVMNQSMEVRRNIGYLPESVPLYTEMRVEEYLLYRAKLKSVPRKIRAKRLDYCLERCRLREVRRRLLGTLSKGYRQRVGLADAMIHEPAILILDEPTSGLDPLQIRETLALIKELGEKHTVLLSTHILSEVEAICERVIIIKSGKIKRNSYLVDLESSSILLEARGPAGEIRAVLEAVEGVEQVQEVAVEDGVARFDIHTLEDADLREPLAGLISSRGWSLRRLERTRRRLEDTFFDVVRAEDPLKYSLKASSSAANGSDENESTGEGPQASSSDAITR